MFLFIVRDLEVTCPVVSTVVPHIGQHFVLVGDSEVTCLSVSLVVSHFIRRFDSVGDLEPLEPFDPSWRTTVDSVSTPLSTLRSRPRSETNPILRGGEGTLIWTLPSRALISGRIALNLGRRIYLAMSDATLRLRGPHLQWQLHL
jgi:hypothetical protein